MITYWKLGVITPSKSHNLWSKLSSKLMTLILYNGMNYIYSIQKQTSTNNHGQTQVQAHRCGCTRQTTVHFQNLYKNYGST